MPTSKWSTMRQEILRPLGLVTGSATATTSSTVVTDSKLSDRFPVDDYFNDQWFIHITEGNDAGKSRRVGNYVGSTGAVTIAGSNISGNDTPNFEVSQFHADDVKRAYNRARQVVFPHISMVRDLETVVAGDSQYVYTLPSNMRLVDRIFVGNRRGANSSDNLLLNGDFEDWDADSISHGGSQNNWALSGSGAYFIKEADVSAPNNYLVLSGSNSGLIKVASATTTLLQSFNAASSSYTAVGTEGAEVNLAAWVYCRQASKVALYIGSANTTFHGGTGWELLKYTAVLSSTATTVDVGLSVAASNVAAYVDEIWMTIGPSEMTDLPFDDVRDWEYTGPAAGASDGGTVRLRRSLGVHRGLRIVGRDLLSPVTVDSSTVEIDGELLEPLYFKVRQFLCEERSGHGYGGYWTEQADRWRMDYESAIKIDGVAVRSPMVAVPRTVF